MRYLTASEMCNEYAHCIPDNVWNLRRWVKEGKFPPHDTMIKRGNKTLQGWSEYTILMWRTSRSGHRA